MSRLIDAGMNCFIVSEVPGLTRIEVLEYLASEVPPAFPQEPRRPPAPVPGDGCPHDGPGIGVPRPHPAATLFAVLALGLRWRCERTGVSRSVEIGDRVTAKTLASMAEGARAQPLARINAPTPRNVAVFALSLLPWPTAIAIALAVLTQRLDWRVWLALTVIWSTVEFAIRNPHQVTLERLAATSAGARGANDLDVRSWWSLLVRSPGKTIALGPDSRLVRNAGVIDCSTGKLIELRIYRWQFSELVRGFQAAGFEVHDERGRAPSRWRKQAPYLLVSVVAAVAAAAVALVEIRGW